MLKAPTITIDGFISPLKCSSDGVLEFIELKAQQLIPFINNYYGVTIDHIVSPVMLNPDGNIVCDNSYYRNRWVKKNNYDFTGYIALSDYNNTPPFDIETEVYGGELVFKTYNASIQPEMGKLVIYPSLPNFAHRHLPIKLGNLKFIKFYFVCKSPFAFDFTKYSTQFTQNITL